MKNTNLTLLPASQRGFTNAGRLKSYHSFSFGRYYDPQNMGFGPLRVINDDEISGGSGFPPHPHDNMEIISIPLEGGLMHEDSLGNKQIIGPDMIQVMSAGSGIAHAEYNAYSDQTTKFLQIWIEPNQYNVSPRHIEKKIDYQPNQLKVLCAPTKGDDHIQIYQDAIVSRGKFDHDQQRSYRTSIGNALYLFVIEGSVAMGGVQANKRDAITVTNIEGDVQIDLSKNTDLLVFELQL